jgi:hypothetical protein
MNNRMKVILGKVFKGQKLCTIIAVSSGLFYRIWELITSLIIKNKILLEQCHSPGYADVFCQPEEMMKYQ